ncbi:8-oxoguanine DNA glycosylase OGG fold protein [Isoptericola rhizosphaerae]|uniref:8-oxoguanine DNA glycosylase OGG fold protein n=1 Tax=Isoptericola rhizosphaerae TaxID=3377837 RepID=UPI00383ABD03
MAALAGGQQILDLLSGTEDLLGQDFKFRPNWWTGRVDPSVSAWLHELPGDPGGRGYHRIDRGRMLATGDGSAGWESRALLAGYVWGTGHLAFLVGRRARTFRDTEPADLQKRLESSVEALAADGPTMAYRALHRGPGSIKHLGPAFFTKFLYVADASRVDRPDGALIMDQFVVKSLNALHGWSEPTYGWSPSRYPEWLAVATEQAAIASDELGRHVRRDEIELAYFRHGKSV